MIHEASIRFALLPPLMFVTLALTSVFHDFSDESHDPQPFAADPAKANKQPLTCEACICSPTGGVSSLSARRQQDPGPQALVSEPECEVRVIEQGLSLAGRTSDRLSAMVPCMGATKPEGWA